MALNIFRKDMLVSALIITIAIFLVGFYLGDKLDEFRIDDATQLLNEGELHSESFEAQDEFFNLFTKNSCSLDIIRLNTLGKELGEMGRTLAKYDIKKLTHRQSYINLERKYFISELKFYNFKKKMSERCDNNDPIILFFYDIEDNQESLRQGYVLDVLGRGIQNLSVLSFDMNFDDGSVKALKNYYGIKTAPTIVVNFEKKIEGFFSEGELRAILKKQ